MKYYLGYYQNQRYIPIRSDEIGDSILSVVEYTTSFTSIKNLKEHLFKKGLIPSQHTRIDYVIQKGNKDNRSYQPLKLTDKIYTCESKRFFNLPQIKECLKNESGNTDFLVFLNAKYIKKYGYTKRIINSLYEMPEEKLEAVLIELKKITINSEMITAINHILDCINKKNNNFNRDILEGKIDSLARLIASSTNDVTNYFIYFKRQISFRKIPAMSFLSEWLQLSIGSSQNGSESQIYSSTEYINKDIVIDNFFNEIIYYYDYEKKEFKKENGSRKINIREVFDLGVFLEEYFSLLYEDYVSLIQEERIIETTPEDDDYEDKEEFLTEEDFERVGTTSEEMGYNTRKQRW